MKKELDLEVLKQIDDVVKNNQNVRNQALNSNYFDKQNSISNNEKGLRDIKLNQIRQQRPPLKK